MTIKVTKTIAIDDFIELWDNIVNKKWNKVMPGWDKDVLEIWGKEIKEKFTMRKKYGSYGTVTDDMLRQLAYTLTHTQLPRNKGYRLASKALIARFGKDYAKVYPYTYVKTGYLKNQMDQSTSYESDIKDKSMAVRVNIPLKPDPTEARGYEDLEESRSYIKSSFILAWPKMLRKTLDVIGK